MAAGAGPAHAMYFSCYEYLKEKLTPYAQSSSVPESLVHAFAGASATVLHDGIMTPAEGGFIKAFLIFTFNDFLF